MIKNRRAFIIGLRSLSLGIKEKKFLTKYKPWGVIIFKRNIKNFDQLLKLITLDLNLNRASVFGPSQEIPTRCEKIIRNPKQLDNGKSI